MASWIDAYDQCLNDVPGCAYPVAANALRTAAQVFCERTRAWRVALDPYLTLANVSDYEFDLSTEQEIVKVISAKIDGRSVDLVLPGEEKGAGSCIVVHDPFSFSIYPAPAKGQRVEIMAALEPSNTASTLDDQLFRKYIRIIAMGAKSVLFGMTNQPFSNPAAARQQRQDFDDEIDKVITQLGRAFSSARPRVRASFV